LKTTYQELHAKQGDTYAVDILSIDDPGIVIQRGLDAGVLDMEGKIEVPDAKLKDGNWVVDAFLSNIIEQVLGINVN